LILKTIFFGNKKQAMSFRESTMVGMWDTRLRMMGSDSDWKGVATYQDLWDFILQTPGTHWVEDNDTESFAHMKNTHCLSSFALEWLGMDSRTFYERWNRNNDTEWIICGLRESLANVDKRERHVDNGLREACRTCLLEELPRPSENSLPGCQIEQDG
jgi:hypothetical protein